MLHSDQSDSSLQGAHLAQRGICLTCEESYGWWQGAVITYDGRSHWICAGCAALMRIVPPPAGWMSLQVHASLWETLGLSPSKNHAESACRFAPAFPLILAWVMEMGRASGEALRSKHLIIPRSLEPEWAKHGIRPRMVTNLLAPTPAWWNGRHEPEPWLYLDSDPEVLFHRVMTRVIDDPEMRDSWDRSFFSEDSSAEDGWVGKLPENHPKRNRGHEWAFVMPWHLIRDRSLKARREANGYRFSRAQVEQVEANFIHEIQSRVLAPDEELPPFWDAVGLPGAHRG